MEQLNDPEHFPGACRCAMLCLIIISLQGIYHSRFPDEKTELQSS